MMEDINIKIKAANINQKLPTSNIVPKKETWENLDKKVEKKNTKTIKRPLKSVADLGKTIFPSKNLAIAQKTTAKLNPPTKNKPLEISIGIFVPGKKKSGNPIITKKVAKNENLLNIFRCIC